MAKSDKTGFSSWFSLNVGLVHHFFYCQCESWASKECFKQVTRPFDDLAKKLRLWCLLKLKMLLRLLKRSSFRGERSCEKGCPSVAFFMVAWSLSQLGEIFIEGCEDSHIKKPKIISGYLEKERILFRKTQRWKNVSWGRPKGIFVWEKPEENT